MNRIFFNGIFAQLNDHIVIKDSILAISCVGSREALSAITAAFSLQKEVNLIVSGKTTTCTTQYKLKKYQQKIPKTNMIHCVLLSEWLYSKDYLFIQANTNVDEAIWFHLQKNSLLPMLNHWQKPIMEWLNKENIQELDSQHNFWRCFYIFPTFWDSLYAFILQSVAEKQLTETPQSETNTNQQTISNPEVNHET